MGLRDLQIPTETITVKGGSFTVRGLSFADLITLANAYGPEMALAFGRITAARETPLTEEDVKTIIRDLVPQFPALVGKAIALASDDTSAEAAEIASRLNFQQQTRALEAMFNLTFTSEAELKNFAESIIRMLTGAAGLMQQVRLQVSEGGFGDSDAM
jgi:hypothetical protein